VDIPNDLFILANLERSGKWIVANGHEFYYETYGKGDPLLLFHGGISSLDTFRYQVAELAMHYQVILPERRGHGHTPDSEGPYSYQQMAEDMVNLMKALRISKASMVGYSDGANLILPLALQHPERVDKWISIGGNFHHKGCLEAFDEELQKIPEGEVGPDGIDRNYEKYSPDGSKHFPIVFHKVKRLWLEEPNLTVSDLKKITAPALIMAGDHDVIDSKHTIEFYESLPNAYLNIVPGTTHSLMKEKPKIVNQMILDFLQNPYVPLFEDPKADIQES